MLRLIATVLLGLLIVCYVFLQDSIIERRQNYRTSDKILLVADRPAVTKALALGFDNMVADMMWIRGIQYFGGNFSSLQDNDKKRGFINLFENLTTLDPNFIAAWEFGGFVYNEACKDPQLAVDFLSRGGHQKGNEGNWKLLFDAGFISFFSLEQYDKAKELFLEAAKRPGCPPYVERMAFEMDYASGRFIAAWRQYVQYAADAEKNGDTVSLDIANDKLDTIYINEVTIHLDNATTLYRVKNDNKYPSPDMHELLESGALMEAVSDFLEKSPDQKSVFEILTGGTMDLRRLLFDRKGQSPLRMLVSQDGTETVVSFKSRAVLAEEQQDAIRNLQQMAEHYEGTEPGRPLEKLEDIFEQEWATNIPMPKEPLGGEFYWDTQDRQVKVRNMQW